MCSVESGQVGVDDRGERVDRRRGRQLDDVELAPVRGHEPHAPPRRGRAPCPPPPVRGRWQVEHEARHASTRVPMMSVTVGASRQTSETGHRHHRRETTRSRIATRPRATLATRSAHRGARGPTLSEGGTSHPRTSTRPTTNPARPVASARRSERVTACPGSRSRRARRRPDPMPSMSRPAR